MAYENATYEGQMVTPPVTTAYYTGSDSLVPGDALYFDHDSSGLAAVTTQLTPVLGASAAAVESARQGRAGLVERATLANMLAGAFAGFVIKAVTGNGVSVPVELSPLPPAGHYYNAVDIATDQNCAVGDLLGPIPGSYKFGRAVVPGNCYARVAVAADRSVTSGLVNVKFGKFDVSEYPDKIMVIDDHFVEPFISATGTVTTANNAVRWMLSGTSATAIMAATGTTIAATGGGELTLLSNTTNLVQMMMNGGPVKLTTGRSCFFSARLKVVDITQADLCVGLCAALTANNTNTGTTPASTDYICFFVNSGTANGLLNINTRKASGTEQTVSTGSSYAAATYFEVAFIAINRTDTALAGNKSILTFFNRVAATGLATTAADAAFPNTVPLVPHVASTGDASAATVTIDRITCIMNF